MKASLISTVNTDYLVSRVAGVEGPVVTITRLSSIAVDPQGHPMLSGVPFVVNGIGDCTIGQPMRFTTADCMTGEIRPIATSPVLCVQQHVTDLGIAFEMAQAVRELRV